MTKQIPRNLVAMYLQDVVVVYASHMLFYWGAAFALYPQHAHQRALFCKHAAHVLKLQLLYTPLLAPLLCFSPHKGQASVNALWQIPMCVVLVDLIFAPLHYAVHASPQVYQWMHKLHHSVATQNPIGVTAPFASPTEHVILNSLPPVLVGIATQCNPLVFALWIGVASANTVVAHSREDATHIVHHKTLCHNYGVGPHLVDRYILGTVA